MVELKSLQRDPKKPFNKTVKVSQSFNTEPKIVKMQEPWGLHQEVVVRSRASLSLQRSCVLLKEWTSQAGHRTVGFLLALPDFDFVLM